MKANSPILLFNLITALLSGARAYNGIVDHASHHNYARVAKRQESKHPMVDLCRKTYPATNYAINKPCSVDCKTSQTGDLLGTVNKEDDLKCDASNDDKTCYKGNCISSNLKLCLKNNYSDTNYTTDFPCFVYCKTSEKGEFLGMVNKANGLACSEGICQGGNCLKLNDPLIQCLAKYPETKDTFKTFCNIECEDKYNIVLGEINQNEGLNCDKSNNNFTCYGRECINSKLLKLCQKSYPETNYINDYPCNINCIKFGDIEYNKTLIGKNLGSIDKANGLNCSDANSIGVCKEGWCQCNWVRMGSFDPNLPCCEGSELNEDKTRCVWICIPKGEIVSDNKPCCAGLKQELGRGRNGEDVYVCVKDCDKNFDKKTDKGCCSNYYENDICYEHCWNSPRNSKGCPDWQICDGSKCLWEKAGFNCGGDGQEPINGRCCMPIAYIKDGKCTYLTPGRCGTDDDCKNKCFSYCKRDTGRCEKTPC